MNRSELPPGLRSFAAEQLNVDAQASSNTARAAFLRHLPDADFVPPPLWKSALGLLTGRATPQDQNACLAVHGDEEEDRLRGEIADYAADFFKLPPAARQNRYRELEAQTALWPQLTDRVRRLEPGLKVERSNLGMLGGMAPMLGDHILELFVLPPLSAASRRHELLSKWRPDRAVWEGAANRLCKERPDIAVLQRDMVQKLLIWRKSAERIRKTAAVAAATAAPRQETNPMRYAWIAGIILLALIRGLTSSGSRTNYNPPDFKMPEIRVPEPQQNDELKRFLEDLEKRQKEREKMDRKMDDKEDKEP